jgi:Protein of unknown function (DUF3833)
MKLRHALCLGAALLLSACATAQVEDYAAKTPTLDLRQFLNGHVDAWGTFIDNSGKAEPTFYVSMNGKWKNNVGTIHEHFDYSDGRTQDRVWTMTFSDDHNLTGTATDVVGTAVGSQYGNAANLHYILPVTTQDGDTYEMSMDDWIYMMNKHVAINRNVMSKYGFKVGELILTFHKADVKPHKKTKTQ